jgi:microcin C transport system permease protein
MHRRGFIAFCIFTGIFCVTLFAELIANDRPLLVSYKGHFFFPVVKDYPESTFGGFLAQTDYRDPAIADGISQNGWMLWPPIRFSYDTRNLDLPSPAPSPPTWMLSEDQCRSVKGWSPEKGCWGVEWNWLGTDDQGRDVLARLIYGVRLSLLFGVLLTALSSLIGVAVGAFQGYCGGWVDLLGQRMIEIWTSIPTLYLLIIISSLIVPGFFVLLGILFLFSWVTLVGVVRAEFLRVRNFEYARAAHALGLSHTAVVVRHLLPNAVVAALTFLPFVLNGTITTLTSLDFLGFGLPPGSPSLGELLAQGKANLQAPWLGITGFFSVAILLSLLVFIGEGVRDAFDPRKILAL